MSWFDDDRSCHDRMDAFIYEEFFGEDNRDTDFDEDLMDDEESEEFLDEVGFDDEDPFDF